MISPREDTDSANHAAGADDAGSVDDVGNDGILWAGDAAMGSDAYHDGMTILPGDGNVDCDGIGDGDSDIAGVGGCGGDGVW